MDTEALFKGVPKKGKPIEMKVEASFSIGIRKATELALLYFIKYPSEYDVDITITSPVKTESVKARREMLCEWIGYDFVRAPMAFYADWHANLRDIEEFIYLWRKLKEVEIRPKQSLWKRIKNRTRFL